MGTYLYNIFLKDPIKTQLAHGVDGLPLLGLLSGYEQIGNFCGRDQRILSTILQVLDPGHPMYAEPWGLLNTFASSIIQ